jgi:hypothetical protein
MSHREPDPGLIFAASLARATPSTQPYAVAINADRFMRLARAHGNIQVTRCERSLTTREEAREARIERDLAALAKECGVSLKLGGDPRGCTVKLAHPAFPNSGWDTGWYGVPQ